VSGHQAGSLALDIGRYRRESGDGLQYLPLYPSPVMVDQEFRRVKGIHLHSGLAFLRIMDQTQEALMNKYLVKALVSRQGESASVRFVPMDIFELWKAHMQHTHDYQIRPLQVSLWVATEALDDATMRTAGIVREPVVKVSVVKKVGTFDVPVERYFSEADMNSILPKFLAHYGLKSADSMDTARVRLTRGFLLPSEDVFEDEL
jgi:hypothetical protein